jgi:2-polyprenyl-3-methyl-5-hydroxy-6-metoxy-1,4-benzoquinol methylase
VTSVQEHWAAVYAKKDPHDVSWYQAEPALSLALIERAAHAPARVIDVGGGTSFLADRLLARGYHVGVLDVSERALAVVQARLDTAAQDVEWFVADATSYVSPHVWDVWHDRAVFHFLVHARDRAAYRLALTAATVPGSAVIIATFGPDGPERCSGLPIVRYSPAQLAAELGAGFEAVETAWEVHHTPAGAAQQFVYCRFVRSLASAGSTGAAP